ncbi:hypothetical protein KL912_001816 [Ogataea haglerorum]|nr:hypothetical protein KL912_001816 [Ogataea haglerorum]
MTNSINKVAIIGGGAGGLVTLNEFLHTSKSGRSTITRDEEHHVLPDEPAFEEIVVFEQNDSIGGVWNYTKNADEGFPTDIENYYTPLGIRPPRDPPTDLTNTDSTAPVEVEAKRAHRWNTSGVYDGLYTNVPISVMRFSSGPPVKSGVDCDFHPFVMHHHVLDYLKDFAKSNDLEKYIRFNSSIEQMYKDEASGKWVLTVVNTENGVEKWYQETFDAVVVAVGKFNIPYFPKIPGLPEYSSRNGNVRHAKSYRNASDYKDKKLLIVGSNVSAIDMLQYLVPVCKEIHVSINVSRIEDFNLEKSPAKNWIEEVLRNPDFGIKLHPKIHHFSQTYVGFHDGKQEHFDEVILATGYHTYYPFLNVPQNEGKEYAKILPSSEKDREGQLNIVRNLYLYTFAVGDPTLCHIGLPMTPLFFLLSEVSAIAIAGVWTNAKKLPPPEKQREWIEHYEDLKRNGTSLLMPDFALDFYNEIHSYGPKGRYNFFDTNGGVDIAAIKKASREYFYKVISGKLHPE